LQVAVINNVKKMKKIDGGTALGRDAVFVCFAVAILATPASKYMPTGFRAIANGTVLCSLQ